VGRWRHSLVSNKPTVTMQIAQRIYSLAREQNNPALEVGAYRTLAPTAYFLGDFETAREYAMRGVEIWRSRGNGLLIISNPTPFASTISGITFNGDNASGNDQIGFLIKTPALLHDCNFTSNGGLLDMVRFATNGGVIWNWTFYDNGQNEEAITFKNASGGSSGVSPNWTTMIQWGWLIPMEQLTATWKTARLTRWYCKRWIWMTTPG
jgi:hypothetical protein